MFTAEEVARMLLEKAHNTLKKHEEILKKSKNSAHEIDAGEEPKNDEAECPDSLKGEGSSEASKSEPKKENSPVVESEDSEMEDEPLSDGDSDEEEPEKDEDKEDKFEFKKSESGMHTVQYKTLKKARVDEGKSASEKESIREDRGMTQKRGERNPYDRGLTGEDVHHDTEWNKRDVPGKNVSYAVKGTKKRAINSIKEDSKKNAEAHKKNRPNLPKSEDCEYEVKKSASGMHTVQYKTLKKFGSQGAPLGSNLGSSIAAGIKGIKKEENQPAPKENPQYHIRATNEKKTPKEVWTTDTKRHIDYSRSGMKGAKPSSAEDQKRFEAEAKERAKKFKEQSKK